MFSFNICAYANKLKQNISILTGNPTELVINLDVCVCVYKQRISSFLDN